MPHAGRISIKNVGKQNFQLPEPGPNIKIIEIIKLQ